MSKGIWFFVSLLVIGLDQLSKHWVLTHLVPYQSESLLPMLNLTLAYNSGAAFSLLSSSGEWHRWFFAGFGLLMSGLIAIFIIRLPKGMYLQLLALSLILGGALGNLLDRYFIGYVVDFIDVYYKTHHWPVFNIADSAICIGGGLLFIDLYKNRRA